MQVETEIVKSTTKFNSAESFTETSTQSKRKIVVSDP